MTFSLWLPGAVVALAMALVGLLVAGRLSTRREVIVEDSIDFRDALAIWSPVIFAVNPTPRGVKRYRNRLRFLAMRVRGEDVQPDWLDRLFGGLGHAVRQVATTSSAITEPKLVALGAIDALDPEILTGSSEERTARLADALKQREHELGIPIGGAGPG